MRVSGCVVDDAYIFMIFAEQVFKFVFRFPAQTGPYSVYYD